MREKIFTAVGVLLCAALCAGPCAAPRDTIDASTINRKLLMGYQGWFACPGDSSPLNGWFHWFRNQKPDSADATVDMFPDLSEFGNDELFPTRLKFPNGDTARLYGAYKEKSVMRHFQWMKDYGLDGVLLQRFLNECKQPANFAFRNKVTMNVRKGAETYGRVFGIMYDISGATASTMVHDLVADWKYCVDSLQVTASPRYLRQNGKPLLVIWGFGFTDRPGTPAQAAAIIDSLKNAGAQKYRVTLMGGVPTYWRTLNNDSQTDTAWASVYRSLDILSPWLVGRFTDTTGANTFLANLIKPDLAACQKSAQQYMPVVWPGYSVKNLSNGPLNQIPRKAGSFYWHQVYNCLSAGDTLLYGAMFDEVDESTAMYKLAPNTKLAPAHSNWVTLDIDGTELPSDWYLQLANSAGQMLRGEIKLTNKIPITPTVVRGPGPAAGAASWAQRPAITVAPAPKGVMLESAGDLPSATAKLFSTSGRRLAAWRIPAVNDRGPRLIPFPDGLACGVAIFSLQFPSGPVIRTICVYGR